MSSENQLIDWKDVKIMDYESNRTDRVMRQAMWIRKTNNMNRDDWSYQLSHIWDKLLTNVRKVEFETSINSRLTLFWLCCSKFCIFRFQPDETLH